jgi:hypothetical protein
MRRARPEQDSVVFGGRGRLEKWDVAGGAPATTGARAPQCTPFGWGWLIEHWDAGFCRDRTHGWHAVFAAWRETRHAGRSENATCRSIRLTRRSMRQTWHAMGRTRRSIRHTRHVPRHGRRSIIVTWRSIRVSHRGTKHAHRMNKLWRGSGKATHRFNKAWRWAKIPEHHSNKARRRARGVVRRSDKAWRRRNIVVNRMRKQGSGSRKQSPQKAAAGEVDATSGGGPLRVGDRPKAGWKTRSPFTRGVSILEREGNPQALAWSRLWS